MKKIRFLCQLTGLFLAGLLGVCLALPGSAPAQVSSRIPALPVALSQGPDAGELTTAGQLPDFLPPPIEITSPQHPLIQPSKPPWQPGTAGILPQPRASSGDN